jgi:3-hydroxyisobutyrate dehydrogenase-like beta-hydroxyacid dehydrogenase
MTPVGIIGLGLMGTALSERLIDAKLPVIGLDIEAACCDKLRANGNAAVIEAIRPRPARSEVSQ